VYGYPKEDAARIAVATLLSAATRVTKALLVAFDGVTEQLYEVHIGDAQ
jgi:O-acetyl-ADP-ribose deacetylase (regulator of RNase III)